MEDDAMAAMMGFSSFGNGKKGKKAGKSLP